MGNKHDLGLNCVHLACVWEHFTVISHPQWVGRTGAFLSSSHRATHALRAITELMMSASDSGRPYNAFINELLCATHVPSNQNSTVTRSTHSNSPHATVTRAHARRDPSVSSARWREKCIVFDWQGNFHTSLTSRLCAHFFPKKPIYMHDSSARWDRRAPWIHAWIRVPKVLHGNLHKKEKEKRLERLYSLSPGALQEHPGLSRPALRMSSPGTARLDPPYHSPNALASSQPVLAPLLQHHTRGKNTRACQNECLRRGSQWSRAAGQKWQQRDAIRRVDADAQTEGLDSCLLPVAPSALGWACDPKRFQGRALSLPVNFQNKVCFSLSSWLVLKLGQAF